MVYRTSVLPNDLLDAWGCQGIIVDWVKSNSKSASEPISKIYACVYILFFSIAVITLDKKLPTKYWSLLISNLTGIRLLQEGNSANPVNPSASFKCDKCYFSDISEENLRSHLLYHGHGHETPPFNKKNIFPVSFWNIPQKFKVVEKLEKSLKLLINKPVW